MTLEATIDRPAADPLSMPWPPATQKMQRALEARIESLTAELERQGELLRNACMVSARLRGLALMLHGVFCDTTLTEDESMRLDRSEAAYLVEELLRSYADRLDMAEDHARTSRNHALAGDAR